MLSWSFTRLSPDLSVLRLHTTICRMPGIWRKWGRKGDKGEEIKEKRKGKEGLDERNDPGEDYI